MPLAPTAAAGAEALADPLAVALVAFAVVAAVALFGAGEEAGALVGAARAWTVEAVLAEPATWAAPPQAARRPAAATPAAAAPATDSSRRRERDALAKACSFHHPHHKGADRIRMRSAPL